MRLHSEILEVPSEHHRINLDEVLERVEKRRKRNQVILRWGLVGLNRSSALVEVAWLDDPTEFVTQSPRSMGSSSVEGFRVAMVVPTGVGAAVGGFIGDSGPVMRVLEEIADEVVTHPNVVNGAGYYGAGERSLYVDGLTLDRFFRGEIGLSTARPVKMGLLLDQVSAGESRRIANAANACRAVWGTPLEAVEVLAQQLRSHVLPTGKGHYYGVVENPEGLIEAAQRLVRSGVNAIAVVTAVGDIPDGAFQSHYMGAEPNPVGSLEALISRAVTWCTGVPCAHAPAFEDALGRSDEIVDPRAAAEIASTTGLPCILRGLSRAVHPVLSGGTLVDELRAILVPFDCAGGEPARAAGRLGIPLLAVRANKCAVGVGADRLDVDSVVDLEDYSEALAYVACSKAGVSWSTIRRPLVSLRFDGTETAKP